MKKPYIIHNYQRCLWHWWCTLSCEYLQEFRKKFEMLVKGYTITHRARWKIICSKKPGLKILDKAYKTYSEKVFLIETLFKPNLRHFLRKDSTEAGVWGRITSLTFLGLKAGFKSGFWVSIRTFALCLHSNICFWSPFEHLLLLLTWYLKCGEDLPLETVLGPAGVGGEVLLSHPLQAQAEWVAHLGAAHPVPLLQLHCLPVPAHLHCYICKERKLKRTVFSSVV